MEALFDNVGHRIYRGTYRGCVHAGYVVAWKAIAPVCKKWSGNRDCDPARIEEIARFRQSGGYFPLLIHLAELPEEGLVCYDGNHRREVLDRDCENTECVVDVMFAATPSEVYTAFVNLNKSVQVPSLYSENELPPAIRKEIVALAQGYVMQYPDFASPSPNPKRPNFNRDNFTTNLTEVYGDFAGTATVSEIAALLRELNNERAKGNFCKPHSEYPRAAVAKCQKHGFWLFLEREVTSAVLMKLRARLFGRERPIPTSTVTSVESVGSEERATRNAKESETKRSTRSTSASLGGGSSSFEEVQLERRRAGPSRKAGYAPAPRTYSFAGERTVSIPARQRRPPNPEHPPTEAPEPPYSPSSLLPARRETPERPRSTVNFPANGDACFATPNAAPR